MGVRGADQAELEGIDAQRTAEAQTRLQRRTHVIAGTGLVGLHILLDVKRIGFEVGEFVVGRQQRMGL